MQNGEQKNWELKTLAKKSVLLKGLVNFTIIFGQLFKVCVLLIQSLS